MVTRYNIWQGGGKTTLVPADGGALVAASDYDAALDALKQVLRLACDWHKNPGYYYPEGFKALQDAIGVLVGAGMLEWVSSSHAIAQDKEA